MASSSILLKGRFAAGGPAALHHAKGGRQCVHEAGARWLQGARRDLLPHFHRRSYVRPCRAAVDGSTFPSEQAESLASKSGIAVSSAATADVEEEAEALGDDVDDEFLEEEIVVVKEPVRQRKAAGYKASVRQVAPPPPPAASGYPGSPLFWVGVGVAGAIAASWIGGKVKQQAMNAAMNAAMKATIGGVGNGGNQNPFGMPGPLGGGAGANPFGMPGFPDLSQVPPPPSSPKATVTDTTATPVQKPAQKSKPSQKKVLQEVQPVEPENAAPTRKKGSFRDVKEQELQEEEQRIQSEPKRETFQDAEVVNGGASTSGESTFESGGADISMEQFEKMLEDPNMQQMIYPYLPENMRNPDTFKWMMQNPMYKQEMQKMFTQITSGGNADILKNLDLNSPDMKQQFDQLGMKPEDLIGKIMSDPSIAIAFQNPRIQAAIMDVSSSPMNYMKYQNDKEVMDVFNKLNDLFPGR